MGYAARVHSINQQPNYTVAPFALNIILVLIAPSLLAASMYVELGKIIRLTEGEQYSPIRVQFLTKLFVAGDILAFLTQAFGEYAQPRVYQWKRRCFVTGLADFSGAGKVSQQNIDSQQLGTRIIKVGLVVQILFFGLFLVTTIVFHTRLLRHMGSSMKVVHLPWRKHLFGLYVGSLLIFGRCVYRLVEYVEGSQGFIATHEWPSYAFDALPVALVMTSFAIVHPSEIRSLLMGEGLVVRKVLLIRPLDSSDYTSLDSHEMR